MQRPCWHPKSFNSLENLGQIRHERGLEVITDGVTCGGSHGAVSPQLAVLAQTASLGGSFIGRRILGFGQREQSLNFHFSPCLLPIYVRALIPHWKKKQNKTEKNPTKSLLRMLGENYQARRGINRSHFEMQEMSWVEGSTAGVGASGGDWGESPRFLFSQRSQAEVWWLPWAGLCTQPVREEQSSSFPAHMEKNI